MAGNKGEGKIKKQPVSQQSEMDELLETAMYKEVASQAFYIAGQRNTQDAGAITLMKELAEEESKHLEWLKQLKEQGLTARRYHNQKVPNLKVSEYLTGGDSLEGAGLQDTLTFAIKREQQAVEFYSNMMSVMRDKVAKRLCQRFVRSELGHKYKLETFYDDLFYAED